MSSVIPARLQFQCGHAALVSLPRVKGETSAQRNERIAFEKSAALLRQCDFCAPQVQIAIASPDTVAVVVREEVVSVGDQVVVVEEPVAVIEEATAVMQQPASSEEETVVVIEEPVVVIEDVVPAVVEVAPVETPTNGKVHLKPTRTRRPARRNGSTSQGATPRQFIVEYQVQRMLRATDIHDVVRQAAALGATSILSATRED